MNKNLLTVTIYTGTVHHVVDLDGPRHPDDTPGRETAICGLRPFWPNQWIVNEGEPTLPACGRCNIALEAARVRQP
jgi:hypothetical protein